MKMLVASTASLSAMDLDKALVIPAHVMARQVGDETVILNLATGMYSGLDPVGARVWQLLAAGHNVQELVSTMLGEFDVSEERLTQDVSALVDGFLSRGLVEVQS